MGAYILPVFQMSFYFEPLFSQNYCKIDAPIGGENFVYSSTYRHVRADLQMSICFIPNKEKIGILKQK